MSRRRRFSREDWVRLGLAELSAKGPEGVKLEAICAAAGLTRGSFYHHFDDHAAYLAALARQWLADQTTEVAGSLDPDAPAAAQGAALTRAAMAIDYRLELGMRELGRRHEAIAAILREADAARLSVVQDIYARRYGLEADTARDLAYLEYAVFSGIVLLDPDMAPERQRALARRYERMMDQVLGDGPQM